MYRSHQMFYVISQITEQRRKKRGCILEHSDGNDALGYMRACTTKLHRAIESDSELYIKQPPGSMPAKMHMYAIVSEKRKSNPRGEDRIISFKDVYCL